MATAAYYVGFVVQPGRPCLPRRFYDFFPTGIFQCQYEEENGRLGSPPDLASWLLA